MTSTPSRKGYYGVDYGSAPKAVPGEARRSSSRRTAGRAVDAHPAVPCQ
jgi:hypothetical protein